MPSGVTPADADGLRATFAERTGATPGPSKLAYRGTKAICSKVALARWDGRTHLWRRPVTSHFNPVVAGLASRCEDWTGSSTRAQLTGADESSQRGAVARLTLILPHFSALPTEAETTTRIERASHHGRPLGMAEWIAMLEAPPTDTAES